jgi:hypothetical protein
MQDQAPAKAGESSTEGPHHELTEDYERSDGQFFSVALAGIAAGQPGSTGLGLANEGGITIEMSDSQASWQDHPYQQEVTMTNPPSWGYDLAGGEAARLIELSGQMASREQAGIEQDEAGQALRSLGMTPSAEKPASLVGLPRRDREPRASRGRACGHQDEAEPHGRGAEHADHQTQQPRGQRSKEPGHRYAEQHGGEQEARLGAEPAGSYAKGDDDNRKGVDVHAPREPLGEAADGEHDCGCEHEQGHDLDRGRVVEQRVLHGEEDALSPDEAVVAVLLEPDKSAEVAQPDG